MKSHWSWTPTGFSSPRQQPRLHYLDSAATSQKPSSQLDAIAILRNSNANPHRGAYALSVRATERITRLASHRPVSRSSRLRLPDIPRGNTEGLIGRRSWGRRECHRGDEIVVTALDHHANFVRGSSSLRETREAPVCELTADGAGPRLLRDLLNPKTKVVASISLQRPRDNQSVAEIVSWCQQHLCDHGVRRAQSAPLSGIVRSLGVDFYA